MGKYFDIGISGLFGGFVGSVFGFYTSGNINTNLAVWTILIAFVIVVAFGLIVDSVTSLLRKRH